MLHEPYCIRSLKFCDICKNVFDISDFDEHTQSHKEKKFQSSNDSKLQSTVTNPVTKQNKNTSNKIEENINLKRLESAKQTCEYCELELSQSEFYDHHVMCGSRSTKCEYCNNKFLYKQINSHLNDCADRLLLEQNAYEDDFTGIFKIIYC